MKVEARRGEASALFLLFQRRFRQISIINIFFIFNDLGLNSNLRVKEKIFLEEEVCVALLQINCHDQHRHHSSGAPQTSQISAAAVVGSDSNDAAAWVVGQEWVLRIDDE